MSNKTLSIIIVNYRSKHVLKKCLASIYGKIIKKIDTEIIIVNNDKNEKLDAINNLFPKIKIINMISNCGFGTGNNAGAKIAQGKFILFLNPDTEIVSNNIEKILSLFSINSNIGIIGGSLMISQNKIQDWSVGLETNLFELIRNKLKLSKSKKIWQSGKAREVDWVSGANFFIEKKLFEKLGGFDENFFMYFEDIDLCKRLKTTGKKILYYPDFRVKHKSGESYIQKEKHQKKDYYQSREYYFKKHCNFFEWLTVKILGKLFY